MSVILLGVFGFKLFCGWNSYLAIRRVSAHGLLAHAQLIVGSHAARFGVVTLNVVKPNESCGVTFNLVLTSGNKISKAKKTGMVHWGNCGTWLSFMASF